LARGWETVRTVIKVYRKTYRHKKPTIETAYFISNLAYDTAATTFHDGIRRHWSIENSLHYVKDVTFHEDASRIRTGNAPQNMSIIKNFVINMLQDMHCDSMKQAIRMTAHNVQAIAALIK
jgi:predicted transposase YbfD/YdcC